MLARYACVRRDDGQILAVLPVLEQAAVMSRQVSAVEPRGWSIRAASIASMALAMPALS